MPRTFRIRSTVLLAILATATPVSAAGDTVQHSQHLALHSVANAPLRSGFVENIHAGGPRIYAHEIYVLNGAVPDATFHVTLNAHPFDPSCDGPIGAVLPTATFNTNRAGNGQGRATVAPEDVEESRRTRCSRWPGRPSPGS